MTRDPKRPELVDQAARHSPAWSGGSRTTDARDRIRAQARAEEATRSARLREEARRIAARRRSP